MSAEVKAATTEDHRVDGSQATGAANDTATDVFRIHSPCVEKAELFAPDPRRGARKTKTQVTGAGTHDDKLRIGKLVI